ncbi:uncharacterized protein LOC115210622 isoform X1 [Octopus sinensis]|uniref:Uncharacterized protein LOC115210622 isoform X1 n=2 Tax=Octopus sinensis TaxID=2607531 RepID=A0A6P7S9R4_9MOLL|nr:uncharacterized protein LOC115210622 isoform X1 [Octopus sinensis]
MDGISEDYNCFQPSHFVVLDSQNSCSKPLNETSFLKSLPALQIPETQTEQVHINPSPNQKSAVSETYQYDIDLIDSSDFSQASLKFLEAPNMESNQPVRTQSGSSSEESHSNFCKPLPPSFVEDPSSKQNLSTPTGHGSHEKSSADDPVSVTIQNVKKSRELAAESKNNLTGKPDEIKSTALARKFLFKSDEDTSEDKDSEPEVNTPSRHIASLQVSPVSVIVSDTADEMNYIDASPEHHSFPIIIPDSPTTDNSDHESGNQESTVMETTVIKKDSQHQSMEYSQNESNKGSKDDSENLHLHYSSTQSCSQIDPKTHSQKYADEICESQDINLYLSLSSQMSENKDMTQSQASRTSFMLKEEKSNQSVHSVLRDSSSEDVLEFTLNLPKVSPGSSFHNPSFSKTPQNKSSVRKTPVSQTSQKSSGFGQLSVSQTSQKGSGFGQLSISQTSQKGSGFGHLSVSQTSQKRSDLANSSDSQTSQKWSGLSSSASDKMKNYQDSMPQLSNSESSQQTLSPSSAANPHKTQPQKEDRPSQLKPLESFTEANPFDSEHFFKSRQKDLYDPLPGKSSQKDQQKSEFPVSAMSSTEGFASKISNEKRINEADLHKKPILDSCQQKTFTKIQEKKDTLSSNKSFSLIHKGEKHPSAKPQSFSQGVIDIRAGDSNGSFHGEQEKRKPASLPDKLISKGNCNISSKSEPVGQPSDNSPNSYDHATTMPDNNLCARLTSTSSQNNNSNAKESIMPYEEEEEEEDEMKVYNVSNQMLIGNKTGKGVSISQPNKRQPSECLGKVVSASVPGQASCSMGETSSTVTELMPVKPLVTPTAEMTVTGMMKTPIDILGKKQYSPLVAKDNQDSETQFVQQDDIAIVQPVDNVTNTVPNPEAQIDTTQDVNVGACTSNDPYLFPDSQLKSKSTIVTSRKRQKFASKSTQKKSAKKLLPKKSSIFSRCRGIRKDRQSPVYRVRFEAIRKRARNPLTLHSNPAFLKVPSHKDIESILSSKTHNNGNKTPSSSDSGSQTKEQQQQQGSLYTNLKKVFQRKITEETTVQIVYRKTTIEMLRNSQVIDRRVVVEKNDPVVIKSTRNEEFKYLNSSKETSFCSPTSLTSGEYADVSSLSHSDSKGSSNNSSCFNSLTVKSSSIDLPTTSSVSQSEQQHKEGRVSILKKGQSVSNKPCQSHTSDEDMLKMLSPITLEDKQEHSAYCSPGDDLRQQSWGQLGMHRITATPDKCNTSVTETATLSRYSSNEEPLKTKTMTVFHSDSLFSSNENLNVSDQEIAAHHMKSLPVSQPSGIAGDCQEIYTSIKNLNLPETSSNRSPLRTSAPQEDLKTPNKAEKQIRGSKRSCSPQPCEEGTSKKYKQDFSDDKPKGSDRSQSPEIPFQDQGNVAAQSGIKKNVHRQHPAIGILIMARWKDGFFYPGKIASPEKNGKYLVKFVDGDKLWVKINQILSVTYLPHGQNVMVQSDDGFFDSGMIVNYKYNGSDSDEDVLYQVQMDDSKIVECSRKQVILSEDQAEHMLSDEDFLLMPGVLSTPVPSGADVSLDNLVDGSRRSASRKVSSENEKNKKLTRMEPRAMSTPTHKRKASTLKKDSDGSICHIGAAIASPKHNYEDTTNRRAKKELFEVVKGPVPKKSLFNAMNFLLTYTEKSPEQKLIDKKLLHEFSSESSTNLSNSDLGVEPKVPFDKNHLRIQLETGGGQVFSSWHKDFLSPHKTSFVVSNTYQRTVKYLQGLAAGIPCVSHLWVRDCCKQGTFLDYKSYLLQAGISITKKTLMESKMKAKCLEDFEILVTSSQNEFVNIWSEILTIAGCRIIKKFRKTKGSNKSVDAVITDRSCPPDIIEQADTQHIPLLSTEWVIQCLIHGQKVAFDGHEKFAYNYEEND